MQREEVIKLIRSRLHIVSQETATINKLKDFFREHSEIYLLYTGYRISPHQSLYLLFKSLDPSKNIFSEDLEIFSLYIAPYNEGREPGILIISPKEDLIKVSRLISSLILTGHRGVLLSPEVPTELKSFLGGSFQNIIVSEDFFTLTSIYLLLRAGLYYISSKQTTPRISRLLREIDELSDVIDDLCNKYSQEIDHIIKILSRNSPKIDLVFTPSTRVFSEDLFEYVSKYRRDIDLNIIPHNYTSSLYRENSTVIIVYTEAEQQMILDTRKRYLFEKRPYIEIILRTDPVITPLYIGLLSRYLIHQLMNSQTTKKT
ncbi:MAG: hypothetical protein ACP5GI_02440 [Sulfolobales archaeon]